MFKTVRTVFWGKLGRAEQAYETQNATIIIEQKIREAESGHTMAKRGLASLIARCKTEEKALKVINNRISDLDKRIQAAIDAKKDKLALEAAQLLADLENERSVRQNALNTSTEKADRIRLNIEKTHRRIIDLQQGLLTAQSIEAERNTIVRMKGDVSANSAISEGEAVLKRLVNSDDPIIAIEAYEEIEAGLSGEDVMDRLSDAGFGAPLKVRADDVLARFKPSNPPKS